MGKIQIFLRLHLLLMMTCPLLPRINILILSSRPFRNIFQLQQKSILIIFGRKSPYDKLLFTFPGRLCTDITFLMTDFRRFSRSTVHIVNTVQMVHTVHTVHTMYTVHTVQTVHSVHTVCTAQISLSL